MKLHKVRHQRSRPKWWMLYLILPLMVGLFSIEFKAPLSPRGHQLAEIVIVLFIFVIVWFWLGASEQALVQEALEENKSLHRGKVYIVLSQDFLPLNEQFEQRVQQDCPDRQSLAHFAERTLPDER